MLVAAGSGLEVGGHPECPENPVLCSGVLQIWVVSQLCLIPGMCCSPSCSDGKAWALGVLVLLLP